MLAELGAGNIQLPVFLMISVGFSLSFLICFISIPQIVLFAKKRRLFDIPNGRKSHATAIPCLGGVGVFASLLLSDILLTDMSVLFELKFIIAGLVILFFVGLKDDILVITPRAKIIGQILAASLVVILGGIRITNFHGLLGINEIPYLVSVLFTIFVFLVVLNGFNLIDGINGLASGVGILVSFVFGVWFILIGNRSFAILSFTLIGALLAFFWFNVFSRRNRIFLGDTGAFIIGFMVAISGIEFMQIGLDTSISYGIVSAPAMVFGILIIPMFDMLRVFFLRLKNGKSPFKADSNHIHHVLLDLGLSHDQATFTLLGVNMFFILLSFSLESLGNILLLGIILATATSLSLVLYMFQLRNKDEFSCKYRRLRNDMFFRVYRLEHDSSPMLTKVS